MNNPFWLISEVRRRGGTLVLADGELRYRGPQGALTDELRQRLRACKGELMQVLAGYRYYPTADPISEWERPKREYLN
ncbi:MAG: hypothetical protein WAN11_22355 [Syntrophobacteraceae bacterium]